MPYKDMGDDEQSGAITPGTSEDVAAGTPGAFIDAAVLKEALEDITGGGTKTITQEETNQSLLKD